MKPIALDLFCGKGGWTNGLLAAGLRVIGFDLKLYDGYQGEFIEKDILTMTSEEIRSYGAKFICCSSPCEQFSLHTMKHFHPNPEHPEMGIKLFEHSRIICEASGIPYIMENVRGAEKFVGQSVNHCGPFYLWGTGVPAIIPPECYQEKKGINQGRSAAMKGMSKEEKRQYRKQFYAGLHGSQPDERKGLTSSWAMIPFSLSSYIGRFAASL